MVEDEILAVVITVPAKFSYPQNEAIQNTAGKVGLANLVILKEPIAGSVT